jgi:integrase
MPISCKMSWDARNRRWWKMKDRKRFVVSCKQLAQWSGHPVPETKEGSYQTANQWWQAKLAEIEAQQPPHPFGYEIQELERRRDWLRSKGYADHAAGMTKMIEDVSGFKESDLHPSIVGSLLEPMSQVWQDRLQRDKPEQVPNDRTIGGQLQAWFTTLEANVQAGKMVPSHVVNIKICLGHFETFIGKESLVEKIDEATLERFHLHLLDKVAQRRRDKAAGVSPEYAKKVFRISKQFIKYCWSKRLLELPRNFDSRGFGFGAGPKAVETFTDNEIKKLLAKATGQLKLHILLMLNCGYRSTDISDLRDDQVDWTEGRIKRKRSKTENHEDVPEVDYKLWPETFSLLEKWRSGGEIVLLTRSGRRWCWEELGENGKTHSADSIATNFRRLRESLGIPKSLDKLRKTSATHIEAHREYGRYKTHFLGLSPRSIADRHYAAPSKELFDEILMWLGRKYGFIKLSEPATDTIE